LSAFAHVRRGTIRRPRQLAEALAVRARSLRRLAAELLAVEEARGVGELLALRAGFSASLGGGEEFVDAFAQTLVHGLVTARWSAGEEAFSREAVPRLLPRTSLELSEIIVEIVGARFAGGVERVVEEIVEVLACTDVRAVFAGVEDPVIHFYEDFLDAYDPRLRKERGVYYTPDEVVSYVVNTSHSALQERFGLRLGLADAVDWGEFSRARGVAVPDGVAPSEPVVQILDPSTGTGTFLLRVIGVIHATMMAEYERAGWDAGRCVEAWRGYVREHLLPRIFGFEILAAPCVICHLRLALALGRTGFEFSGERLRVVRTDTLQIVEDHEGEAGWIKRRAPISVIVGNPPYEREGNGGDAGAHKGGWMLDGWCGWNGGVPPIEDFNHGARAAGAGGNLQTTRNSYYYFWRWALLRVFEAGVGVGVLALVTASSYLRGPGFAGLRARVRGACSEAFVLDLEGDRLGTRISENVFAITIPVCVTTVLRTPGRAIAGKIWYARAEGTRADKLALCAGISSLSRHAWGEVAGARFEPFIARGAGDYAAWCPLGEVFPVRFTGYHYYRTWPIGETREVLERRWEALLQAPPEARARIFKETRDRKVSRSYRGLFGDGARAVAVVGLTLTNDAPVVMRTSFRSFDRKWCIADARVGDFLRPALWQTWGPRQVYMTSLLSGVLGDGPAATAAGHVPDCHHFRGSYGGKDVVPLWCDAEGTRPNVAEEVLAALAAAYGRRPAAVDVFAYAYAVLANPGYVRRFRGPLQIPGPRLPVTADAGLFARGAAFGRTLLRWHTYGERLGEPGDGFEMKGGAAVVVAVPEAPAGYPVRHRYDSNTRVLHVGDGQVGPVSGEVMGLSVSGLQVVKSWLDYRMARGRGGGPRRSMRSARSAGRRR
jgi:hypothetical protein